MFSPSQVLFFFAAVFAMLSPMSLATELEAAGTIKYARVLVCLFGCALAFSTGIMARIGPASRALLFFAVFYSIAPLWSAEPLRGLMYKGIFLLTLTLGVAAGFAARDISSMHGGLRLLGVVAGVVSPIAVYQYIANPEQATHVGRLAVFGMNANALGMTAAGLAVLTFSLVVTERRWWRAFSAAATTMLGIIVVATGSRASLVMVLVGSAFAAVPLVKNPRRLVGTAMAAAVLIYAVSVFMDFQSADRIMDFSKNTRHAMWRYGWRMFVTSPVVGHGWVFTAQRSTSNMQNFYFQILGETGVVGGLVFSAVLFSGLRMVRENRRRLPDWARDRFYLGVGIAVSILMHGVFESGALLGSTLNAFLLGFGVALAERAGQLARLGERPLPTWSVPSRLRRTIRQYV